MTRENIIEALKSVQDPDLKKDIISLGMVRDLTVESHHVSFTFFLTTPACPMKDFFRKACTAAIQMINPQAEISIKFGANHSPESISKNPPGIKKIIAVYSAKGGVGKSTVASNLAIILSRRGAKVGLVDADIYGPSIPSIFGISNEKIDSIPVEGKNKMIPLHKYGVDIISLGMLVPKEQAIVWRGPMASSAVKQLVFDVQWGELDYLIVDLPPGTGDIHLTIMQSLQVSGAIVVSTPQEVAIQDTRRSIAMLLLDAINVPIIGIVENMSYLSVGSARQYIFGKEGCKRLAGEFGLLLLGEIPIEPDAADITQKGPLMVKATTSSLMKEAFESFVDKVVRILSMRQAQMQTPEIESTLNT